MSITDELRQQARDWLAERLGDRAPDALDPVVAFDERPLEGEGPAVIFAFRLARAVDDPERATSGPDVTQFVVVGQTEPNLYADYGLSPDQLYSLHIGTRFMLVLGIGVAENVVEASELRTQLDRFLYDTNPHVSAENITLAGCFRDAEGRVFSVHRVTLAGQDVYCVGGDLPPGFYELTDHPPQVALRLHLGQLIRTEARREVLKRTHGNDA